MKKSILSLMVTVIAISATAQSAKTKISGYGSGIAEITWLNSKPALNIGAYGGVLINHRLLLGAAGNNISFKQTLNGKTENFQFNYYGLYTEYRIMPEKPIHVSVGLTGALGWLENNLGTAQKARKKDGENTFVIQPKLAVNVKITKFMQVQASGSYRITGNTGSLHYAKKNYNGLSAGMGLVFGSF